MLTPINTLPCKELDGWEKHKEGTYIYVTFRLNVRLILNNIKKYNDSMLCKIMNRYNPMALNGRTRVDGV